MSCILFKPDRYELKRIQHAKKFKDMIRQLYPYEVKLSGSWLDQEGNIVADQTCGLINSLIENVLEEISVGNWEALYRDPQDGRFWELSYPRSHLHGGGPPELSVIDLKTARSKYSF